ncbi:MAG: exodeoxyribonuclease III [Bacteroidetes bacterium]|nr:MAG: exodeoxyribonuclease III [Bacteroidota bacterium]
MTKIISYNVNGIRAALKKGWIDWVKAVNPDIVCLQEIKAEQGQLDLKLFEDAGFKYHFWHSAQKKGYSGVAILSKKQPDHVEVGCGISRYDDEGRILRADYGDFSVMSLYMPSGTSGELRQEFKYVCMDDFQKYIDGLKKQRPNLVISGDWNICHKPIDIHNPVSNAKSSGFLPPEREWIGKFMDSGFIDSFRYFNAEPHNYTWWSQRFNSRSKNLGWRIDYHMVSAPLEKALERAAILPEAVHSDHCPILVELAI